MTLQIDRDGAELHQGVIDPVVFFATFKDMPVNQAGVRLKGIDELSKQLGAASIVGNIASLAIGREAFPVRAILFDKSEANNWALDWHQDRTIAVAKRLDVAGFSNWTMKSGIQHVEPPIEVLESMITLRVHLDDVDAKNAPLKVVPGSHKLGLIPEDSYASVVGSSEVAECLAEAGDVWAYRTPILHASKAAVKPMRRRVLQVDYSAEALPGGLQWAGI